MQDCLDLFKSLGQYAAENQALGLDADPQAELKKDVQAAAAGGNTEPNGQGGNPSISLTAPAGVAFTTPKTIVSYAGANIDTVAQQHLQLTAGQRFNLNAGKGISMFAHHDGIKVIAHNGDVLMQSQHGDININADKNINLTATNGVIKLMAKEIHVIAEDGSFIKIGGGITLGTKEDIAHKAANFPFSSPATMAAEFPTFGGGAPDQKFMLQYNPFGESAVIAPNVHYEIDLSDGSSLKGVSDAQGMTDLLQRDAMHIAAIRILKQNS